MSLQVAHLSDYWKAGAVALCRTHTALLDAGIRSRLHVRERLDGSVPEAFQLRSLRDRKTLRDRLWSRDNWSRRICAARARNPKYETFTPPVAVDPHDLDSVLSGADILHLHWTGGLFDFDALSRRLRIPVVWTLHDQNAYLGGFHYQGDVNAATTMLPLEYEARAIKRQALERLNLTVVPNSKWNEGLVRTTDVLPPGCRVEQIYLPLPVADYPVTAKPDAKRALGVDPDQFVLGFASGKLGNRRKGFFDLITAINRVDPAMKSKMTLVSFGGETSAEVRREIDLPWVHLGRIDHPSAQAAAYSAMDCFVIPSIEEAFGQTPAEALACETAVIGTRAGGIPETVIEGVTGLTVEPRSPGRMAQRIEQMYRSPDFRRRCGVEGRALIARRHDPKTIAKRHTDLYQSVLAEATPERRMTAAESPPSDGPAAPRQGDQIRLLKTRDVTSMAT